MRNLLLVPVLTAILLVGTHADVHAQETHLLVITGLGGDAEFRGNFLDWGSRLVDGATSAGVARGNITFLSENPEADSDRIHARSTAEEIEAAFAAIAARAAPEDRVMVVLIGHGSGSGADSRVSIPGPSLTVADYERLLATLAPRSVAFINTASASGDFVPALAGEGRVVVAATRSAQQRNATIFPQHFVEAFAGEGADLDRDGRVSVLEAFEYARQETERHFRDRGLLTSEQALIEDRAQGRGVTLPMEESEVGAVAARFFLQSVVPATVAGDGEEAEELRQLYQEQDRIETAIAQLGQRRGTLGEDAYQEQLQTLLLRLATIGQEIRASEDAGR
jgi:hypothetical protein